MENHHLLIDMQEQKPLPHQWDLLKVAAHRANLTFGKNAISIFVAKFYGRMPYVSPTRTLLVVQDLSLYPTALGCVFHHWHHELVAVFRWTTATAPENLSVGSSCEATVIQVVTG